MNRIRTLLWSGVIACVVVGIQAEASAQGCDFLNPPDMPFWFSVEASGGVSMPLSFSKPLVIKQAAPSFRGGVGMNFYNGIRLLLDYQYQSFSGEQSFYDWVTMHQLQAKGLFPLVESTYIDWHAGPLVGLNFASKKYFLPRYDSKGQLMWKDGAIDGLLLLTRVPGFTAGLGTRVAFFPLEAWSLFLDVQAGYTVALLETLAMEEGALVISGMAGMEMHF